MDLSTCIKTSQGNKCLYDGEDLQIKEFEKVSEKEKLGNYKHVKMDGKSVLSTEHGKDKEGNEVNKHLR